MKKQMLPRLAAGLVLCAQAQAQTLDAEAYHDRLMGVWLGEIIGNMAGRPIEGRSKAGGVNWELNWFDPRDTSKNEQSDGVFYNRTYWDGDDDTVFEYMYTDLLKTTPAPTYSDINNTWQTRITSTNGIYIANRQAYYLRQKGVTPPTTGSMQRNMHWDMIDSQITTEVLGAIIPGAPHRAAQLAKPFAEVTNDGFAVHAAQYYAAMYSIAAAGTYTNSPEDIETIVAQALDVVPTTSRTHQIIQHVRDLYEADKLDGTLNWQATQTILHNTYGTVAGSNGRYRSTFVESSVNTAMTVMSLLYGQGDFLSTVEIGVLAGFDNDCNPATAGGLIGALIGYQALQGQLTDTFGVDPITTYRPTNVTGLTADVTIDQVAGFLRQAAELQITQAGGSIQINGNGTQYILGPDAASAVIEKPDPTGPGGLTAAVLADGGTANVTASRAVYNANNDRANLNAIIDGIIDVSYNGHMAYESKSGGGAPEDGVDWYEIQFDREVTFSSLLFVEGHIQWGVIANGNTAINADPSVFEPKGGYFVGDLEVLVRQGDDYVPVSSLTLSEELDLMLFFQQIELMFDPIMGDAIRLVGTAGGTDRFTTILELEPRGVVPEPAGLGLLALAGLGLGRRRRA